MAVSTTCLPRLLRRPSGPARIAGRTTCSPSTSALIRAVRVDRVPRAEIAVVIRSDRQLRETCRVVLQVQALDRGFYRVDPGQNLVYHVLVVIDAPQMD